MNIVFMGTPDFAATILEDLVEHHEVGAVYTRPDAVRGRGHEKEASPAKRMAQSCGIPVYTPLSFKGSPAIAQLRSLSPDVVCVAAYGMMLPKKVLEIPRYGCLNVHASLLPRWRGAAPIERAILAGDAETGVCVMRMEEGLDTGDFCVCRTTVIGNKSAVELSDELANLGSYALLTALVHLEQGALDWTAQDEAAVTYAEKIGKHEMNPSPKDTARQAALKVQASSDAHPARCLIAGRPVRVTRARDVTADTRAQALVAGCPPAPGGILFAGKRFFLGTVDGMLEVAELKPDGKSVMGAKAFAAGVQGIKQGGFTWTAGPAGGPQGSAT